MNIDLMKGALCGVYPSQKWRDEVADMPDEQVIAIYHSFCKRGIFRRDSEELPIPGTERMVELNMETDRGIILGFDEAIEKSKIVQLSIKI